MKDRNYLIVYDFRGEVRCTMLSEKEIAKEFVTFLKSMGNVSNVELFGREYSSYELEE